MTEPDYNLRPLWDALLDIYVQVQMICERHHLRYYACGGTALGAVRHGGFIPWDDDFDLFMPRPDYMRFVQLAQQELPTGLRWRSIHNDPGYQLPFGKVGLVDASRVEAIAQATRLQSLRDVYIDILPLDGIPAGKFSLFFWLVKRAIWRRVGPKTQDGRLRYEKWISRLPFDKSPCVEDAKEAGARLQRYHGWPREIFSDLILMKFENVQIPMPHETHVFLSRMFGPSYMELPPEEKRRPSHQLVENLV